MDRPTIIGSRPPECFTEPDVSENRSMIEFVQHAVPTQVDLDKLAQALQSDRSDVDVSSAAFSLRLSAPFRASLSGGKLLIEVGDAAADALRERALRVDIDLGTLSARAWTDRYATYPLCYRADCASSIAIASRADALAATPALRSQTLYDYLYFHMIPAPETVFPDVLRLPPGSRLTLSAGKAPTVERWWSPRFSPARSGDFDTLKKDFLAIVRRGVAREATGHYAAFLSGGTDSSTVVGMLCREHGPVRAYSMGFEAEGYDEMEYARLAARHFGASHHEHYVTPDELVAAIPKVAAHYDQPFGNSSALPAYILSQIARDEGYDKLLAGDGGDELFGGNSRYAKNRVFGFYDNVPGVLRAVLEPLLSSPLGKLPLASKGASYVEQARVPMPARNEMYNMLLRLGPETIFTADFLAQIDRRAPLTLQQSVWDSVDADDDLNRELGFDWRFTLADNDLPKVIGTTSLAGLDVGFPLLSDELLDFSLDLPLDYKLKGFDLRWFFKEALRGFLPDEIITKKKHGFGLPFGHWALKHDGLNALSRASVQGTVDRGIVRPQFADALFAEHLPAYPGFYGEMVWILMMMDQWMQRHARSGPSARAVQ
jgi:asparagine synthase (glutamine-hydrolysing)